jgi:hypothetical protein
MTFIVKGMCRHGALVHRRKTPDAALRKARELANNGCYDLHVAKQSGPNRSNAVRSNEASNGGRKSSHVACSPDRF